MGIVRELSLVAMLVTTGLMAGIYLAFSIAVLPGVGRQDDRTFVLAMRGMNAAILNGWFAVVFGGPLLLGLVAVGTRLGEHRSGLGWTAVALAAYGGTLGITALVNVPLNDRLDATEDLEAARAVFELRWLRWNHVRTALCTLALVALALAVRD